MAPSIHKNRSYNLYKRKAYMTGAGKNKFAYYPSFLKYNYNILTWIICERFKVIQTNRNLGTRNQNLIVKEIKQMY